ncbi:MAG TPA: hypothetical protein VKU87_08850 [Thermomicrobiaceae bacterium]|nr:hypothetical protein [Thermomicrobiaceae bacterium]
MPMNSLLLAIEPLEPGAKDSLMQWRASDGQTFDLSKAVELSRFRSVEPTGEAPELLELYEVLDGDAVRAANAAGAQPVAEPALESIRAVYLPLIEMPEEKSSSASSAPALLIVGLNIDETHDEEFQEWYNVEHLPRLVAVPGVLRARRYRLHGQIGDGRGATQYLALYDLDDVEVPNSDPWREAVETPWRNRMRRLFTGNRLYGRYQRD